MATTNNRGVESGTGAQRLPSHRLAPAGRSGADGYVWAGRIAAGALAIAALWFGYALVRPLPAPEASEITRTPRAPSLPERGGGIEVRESRLAALTGGNFFSPDREFWPADANEQEAALAEAQRREQEESEAQAAAEDRERASQAGRIDPDRPIAFDEIPVSDMANVQAALRARIQEVRLRGVYRGEDDPVAMIDLLTKSPGERMRSLRVGQKFDEDQWRVVAIDDRSDRVILSRGGHNFVFSLYDSPFDRAPALAQASEETPDEQTGPAIVRRSEEEVRTELADAGLEASEIEDLLALALGDEALDEEANEQESEDAQAVAARAEDAADDAEAPQASTPRGAATILRLLSGNPLQGSGAGSSAQDGGAGSDGDGSEGE